MSEPQSPRPATNFVTGRPVAILMLFIAAGRAVGFAVDGSPSQPALMAFGFEIVIAAALFATSRNLTAST